MNAQVLMTVGLLGAVALGGRAEVAADGTASFEDLTVGEKTVALDLESVWRRTDLSSIPVEYSAGDWGLQETDAGRTVDLQLTPVDGGETKDLAVGLTGHDVFLWTPQGLQRKVYKLVHSVKNGAVNSRDDMLTAFFSFEDCQMEASPEEIREAVMGVSQVCTLVNDEQHPWQPVDGAGSGLVAPEGIGSVFELQVKGQGTVFFDWSMADGEAVVVVDGVTAKALAVTADWTAGQVAVVGFGPHTVRFVSSGTAVKVKSIRWITTNADMADATGPSVRVDLQQGIRRPHSLKELMPFVYSVSNFTGVAGMTADAVARVRVVQITGADSDLTTWEEVDGTEKVLCEEQDESSVPWEGRSGGFWKAEFQVRDGGSALHEEAAYFDMRKFGLGLMILLK